MARLVRDAVKLRGVEVVPIEEPCRTCGERIAYVVGSSKVSWSRPEASAIYLHLDPKEPFHEARPTRRPSLKPDRPPGSS